MGENPAGGVDDEHVRGFTFEGQLAGDGAFEIEEEGFGAVLADGLGDALFEEARDGLDIGDAVDIGDMTPPGLEGGHPGIDVLGAAAVADEEEEGAFAREGEGVTVAELVGEFEGREGVGLR